MQQPGLSLRSHVEVDPRPGEGLYHVFRFRQHHHGRDVQASVGKCQGTNQAPLDAIEYT